MTGSSVYTICLIMDDVQVKLLNEYKQIVVSVYHSVMAYNRKLTFITNGKLAYESFSGTKPLCNLRTACIVNQ